MKIYNKKKFVSGMVCLILSGLLFLSAVMARRAETGNILLILALLAIGGGEIARSLSRQMARKDKLDELDERNRLIAWKTQSKAFQLTQSISFLLMLMLLVMGKVSGYEGFIYMGVGLSLAFSLSLFAELFAYLYYESKN